ncbi:MAG: type III pantothenate kinase [Verrucomicrobiales bacterium]|nr:type III pantothenate kinase [Verrucomicrobiales bacterium]
MPSIQADLLLINNNNTRTKFALASGDGLLEHRSIETAEVTPESISHLLEGWVYEKVVLASVVPSCVPKFELAYEGKPMISVSNQIKLGLEVDFSDPSKVGADRLANAAAVVGRFPGEAVIVVDFGTAVTFDIIDRRPAYIGGVIAPGLDAMRHYLHQRTALLPEIDIKKPDSVIGKTTESAMQAGAYHGYRGLVKEILSRIEIETGESAKVIATGGYAALIAGDMPEIHLVEPYLTMDGLLQIARINFFS